MSERKKKYCGEKKSKGKSWPLVGLIGVEKTRHRRNGTNQYKRANHPARRGVVTHHPRKIHRTRNDSHVLDVEGLRHAQGRGMEKGRVS